MVIPRYVFVTPTGTAVSDYEPYSLRQKRAAQAGQPVLYVYDPIPRQMRVQAIHAMHLALGTAWVRNDRENPLWIHSEMTIMREHGMLERVNANGYASKDRVTSYIVDVATTEAFLDGVEIGFRVGQLAYGPFTTDNDDVGRVNDSIIELNRRFSQHDLGFAFVGWPGIITRVDSQYIHAQVVESAIHQLSVAGWDGPLEEFMRAHKHYRHGNNKEAMNEALKAFESTMKAIIQDQGWHYEENWQAKNLIQVLFDNHLLPSPLESYFGGIRSVLQSGVPTLRNRQSGHGQGSAISVVPAYIAAFTLHLTASNIVFLLSAHAEMPKTESKP